MTFSSELLAGASSSSWHNYTIKRVFSRGAASGTRHAYLVDMNTTAYLEHMDYEMNAQHDYLSEAYGPSAIDHFAEAEYADEVALGEAEDLKDERLGAWTIYPETDIDAKWVESTYLF